MQEQPNKTTWFYYDTTGDKIGPIAGRELRKLAKQGIITPETLVENVEGKSGVARKVKSLQFPTPTSEPGEKSSAIAPALKKTTWFYYNKNGEKRGPFTNRQLKNLAIQGVIVPETRIENTEGQSCLAKNATALCFASPEESTLNGERETITVVIREPFTRTGQKRRESGKAEENTTNVTIIGSVITVALLLGIVSWVFSGYFQKSPPGIIYLEGIVTLDGNPISGVNVILNPRNPEGVAAGGMTDARGRFTVTTHPNPIGSGAMAGVYDVTFSKVEVDVQDVSMMLAPQPATTRQTQAPPQRTYIVPQRYGRPRTSGLEPITVEAGGNNRFTFVLTSE